MGIGRDYEYKTYHSDDGNDYSVKISKSYGDNDALDFGDYDASKPLLPRGMKMRGVNVMNIATKLKRRVPVGTVTSDAWTDFTTNIQLPAEGDADGVTGAIQSRFPEKPATAAHEIANY